jgi:hypothetical protein
MTTDTRTTRPALDRGLHETAIALHGPTPIADPAAFLREHAGADDAIVVIEATDRVRTERLQSSTIDARTTVHAHAFSATRRSQARVARTPHGWIGDAVRECDGASADARRVLAGDERMMCLGERVDSDATTTRYGEARIKPFALPVPNGPNQVDVAFRNYYEETATGRLACVAHRVTGFVAREVK